MDFASDMVARAYCYQVFGSAFAAEPERELFDVLFSKETRAVFDALLPEGERESYARYRDLWASFADDERAAFVSDQRGVYARLFEGPSFLEAPIWDSVYVSDDGLLFQESTLEVRRVYASCGLALEGQGNEADDHLAIELDFMRRLSLRLAEGAPSFDAETAKAQRDFLEAHLLKWVPRFAQRLGEAEGAEFFVLLCELLLALLRTDKESLDSLLQQRA